MSDSTVLQILTIQPEHITDYLTACDCRSNKADTFVIDRTYGHSRNGWFQSASRKLISDSRVGESVRFLSNERCTTSRVTGDEAVDFTVTGHFRAAETWEDLEAWKQCRRWGYRRNYTILLPSDTPSVLAEVEKLWSFCVANIDRHHLLNDGSFSSAEEFFSDLRLFSNLADSGYGDEGDGSGFYFLVLHALRSHLATAVDNSLAVIYLNDEYVGVIEDAETAA